MSYSVLAYCRDCLDEDPDGCYNGLMETLQEGIPTLEEAIKIGLEDQKALTEEYGNHHIFFQIRDGDEYGTLIFSSEFQMDLIKNGKINCDEILRCKADKLEYWTMGQKR